MTNLLDWLQGKKTYFLSAAGALVVFAKLLGWIDEVTASTLFVLLGFGTGAALRSGMKK